MSMVQELQKCVDDPVYFVKNYCKIQHPVKGEIAFELYPYQEQMLTMFANNRQSIVLSARQTGKALSVDQVVPTPTGWTTMGEINVGDFVLGADGKPVLVEAVSEIMHDRQCYQLSVSTGETFTADAEHLWEVRDEQSSVKAVKILTTQQLADSKLLLSDKNQARFTIRTTSALELPDRDLAVDPYMLGVWLGDGSTKVGEYCSHSLDFKITSRLQQLTEYHFNVRPYGKDRQHIHRVGVHGLARGLRSIGVLGDKHIPVEYLRASRHQRLELLRGLMDTDGTVDKNTGGCEIGLSDCKLATHVKQLVASLGLKPTISVKKTTRKDCHVVRFMAYRDEVEVFHLDRKLALQKQSAGLNRSGSTKKRSITSVTATNTVPVRCIRVSNADHMFLIGDTFVPTHNSQVSAAYLLWYAIFFNDKTILIASNKNDNAMEMIHRIQFIYERLPAWLKPGVTADGYNKHNIGFDNGSRIYSTATSENSGRGMAVSLLFCLGGDTKITVRNKRTHVVEEVSLAEMYARLIPLESTI